MVEISRDAALLICGPTSVFLLSTCTLFRFAERRPNCLSFLTSVLGVTLSFSIIAVVPYDVWHALATKPNQAAAATPPGAGGEAETASLLRRSWAAIYWTTTLLCYLLCPVLMEFEASGDFTASARLRTSLRRNAAFYAVYIVAGSAALVWLIVSGEVHTDLESWCIAASNAWGLLVLTVLMGFGLVGVPRHIWRLADPREQLKRLYVSAVTKDELRLSRLFELQDAMDQVRAELALPAAAADDEDTPFALQRTKHLAFCSLQKTLERCEQMHRELSHGGGGRTAGLSCCSSMLPPPGSNAAAAAAAAAGASAALAGDAAANAAASASAASAAEAAEAGSAAGPPSESPGAARREVLRGSRGSEDPAARLRRMAQQHRSLKAAALEARRSVTRWDSHVQRCMFFEDLEGGHFKAAAELLAVRPMTGLPRGCCAHARSFFRLCWRHLLVLWLRTIRARALRLLSWCCGLLSAVIVLGQLTMFSESKTGSWSLSLLAYVFQADRGAWLTQGLCVVPLAYMTYTAYFSIFRLRVPGWYGLYSNHNTDMGSLLWCASILARLAAPLCYHFLLLIRVRGTTFQSFMGKMNVVPVLGESFNDIFPCIIALLCLFNLLNVYSRIVRCLTLGTIDFELAAGAGGEDPLAEGRQLVERERRRLAEESSLELPARERLRIPPKAEQ